MRNISLRQIATFLFFSLVSLSLATVTTVKVLGGAPLGDFRGIVLLLFGLLSFYIFSILTYRAFLWVFPLHPGEIEPKSKQEFIYHVYILFYLMLFYPVMRSGFVPAPLMRVFYLCLGTQMGKNTYTQGIIHDPPFVDIGNDSVIGQFAILVPHVIEGERLAHYPIKVGNHVTIGAHASILADVTIGDGAIVATGSVVRKGSRIGAGETWGGVPAVRIR